MRRSCEISDWIERGCRKKKRAYAHAGTAAALKQYMADFLAEVAPSLTQEQYMQLKNYETTEFARELSRLQQRINAK